MNPFEVLQMLPRVSDPRTAFEDVAATILCAIYPGARRIRNHGGDGGVDVYVGTYGTEGAMDVYQIKYFPRQWEDPQKKQIRDSFDTAANNPDFNLRKWFLCVPSRLTSKDILWFDDWKHSKLPAFINHIDGDELTSYLPNSVCVRAREMLHGWDVPGMKPTHPSFTVNVFVPPRSPNIEGAAYRFNVQLKVEHLTAHNLVVEVTHSDSHSCSGWFDYNDWEPARPEDLGGGNSIRLRFRRALNPGEGVLIRSIPVGKEAPFPFLIKVRIWAQDTPPQSFQVSLTREQAASSQLLPLLANEGRS